MTKDEQTRLVEEWLASTSAPPPPTIDSVDSVMGHVPHTPQQRSGRLSRWLSRRPATADTVTGRTRSMLNPINAITTGVLALAVGGAFLLAQTTDDPAKAPGAEVPAAPTEFSATFTVGSPVRGQDAEAIDGGSRNTGGTWEWTVVGEASDPRLQGTVYMHRNHDDYLDMGSVNHVMLRIENEEGAWQSLPVTYLVPTGDVAAWPVTLIGDGAFDGLYAVADLARPSGFWEIEGYIFEGEPLPAPEPYTPE